MPAAVGIIHAEHEHGHDVVLVCRNTGMSECKCDDDSQSLFGSLTNYESQEFSEINHYNEVISDCYECIYACISINQQKYSCIVAVSSISAGNDLSGCDYSEFNNIQSMSSTPVELRTKLTN